MGEEKPQDPEKGAPPPVEAWRSHPMGYPRLAERMGVRPETLIFRTFGALNARMLLYMQAELVILERKLQRIEQRDNEDKHGNKRFYATDYWYLLYSRKDHDTAQLELVREIQAKLEKYNEALLQQHKLQQVPQPDRFDLNDIYKLLWSDTMGVGSLNGEDGSIWGTAASHSDHAPDLIGVCPRTIDDTFSRWVSENAIYLFKIGLGRIAKADRHLGSHVYYDSSVLKLTMWITSIVASLLPIASILVLISVHTLKAKLYTLAGFNVLFTIILTVFTGAKRSEIFAMTAAFAAVQVVFVGTGPDGSPAPKDLIEDTAMRHALP